MYVCILDTAHLDSLMKHSNEKVADQAQKLASYFVFGN